MPASDEELRSRWRTDYGQDVLARVIARARQTGAWGAELAQFPYADEMPNGLDLRFAPLSGRDLRGVNFGWAHLGGAELRDAILDGASLHAARLPDANLAGARLVGCDLTSAKLLGADLTGADLTDATASGARFISAQMEGAVLHRAKLPYAELQDATLAKGDLTKAVLTHAHLEDADLKSADLSDAEAGYAHFGSARMDNANLTGTRLVRAHLREAKLVNAILTGANLGASDLGHAELVGAELTDADLYMADLTHATLSGAQLAGHARFVDATIHDASFDGVKFGTLGSWVCVDFSGAQFNRGTSFLAVDTSRNDWSANRLLLRHIEDQQWLNSYRSLHPGWSLVWRMTCDYGRSFARWLTWSLAFAVLFGFVYLLFGGHFILTAERARTLAEAHWLMPFYYSVVTFTTLGFGDVVPYPDSWGLQAVIMLEVILGYIMLGGLISILANKLARRS